MIEFYLRGIIASLSQRLDTGNFLSFMQEPFSPFLSLRKMNKERKKIK